MKVSSVKKLPHRKHFRSKLLRSLFVSLAIIVFSLMIGVIGFKYYFNLTFVDALYNASMILTGMGPVNKPISNSAKLFGTFYALYSGIAFLGSMAVILAPIAHRFLHKFHLDIEE